MTNFIISKIVENMGSIRSSDGGFALELWKLSQKTAKMQTSFRGLVRYKERFDFDDLEGIFAKDLEGLSKIDLQKLIYQCKNLFTQLDLPKVEIKKLKEEAAAHEKSMTEPLSYSEKSIAEQFLRNPEALQLIDNYLATQIVGEERLRLLVFFLFAGRGIQAQHVILTGSSSSGKSTVLNAVASLFPTDSIIITRLTHAALDFLEMDLTHKILVCQELDGAAYAASLRPLLSGDQGGLRLLVAEKTDHGNISSRFRTLTGTPCFASSAVSLSIENQLSTRVWTLHPDDSQEQTARVIGHQQALAAKIIEKPTEPPKEMLLALRLLAEEPENVIIPFASAIIFPSQDPRSRRDSAKLLSLIKSITLFNSRARSTIEGNFVSNLADFRLALWCGAEALDSIRQEVDPRLFRVLDVMIPGQRYLPSKVNATNISQSTKEKYLRLLFNKGLVSRDLQKDSKKMEYWRSEVGQSDILGFGSVRLDLSLLHIDFDTSRTVGHEIPWMECNHPFLPPCDHKWHTLSPMSECPTSLKTDIEITQKKSDTLKSDFVRLSDFANMELSDAQAVFYLRKKDPYIPNDVDTTALLKRAQEQGVLYQSGIGKWRVT